MKFLLLISAAIACITPCLGQQAVKTLLRLPDTGQEQSFTNTFGEDNDYAINVPYYNVNGDGTVTDTVTGLMWQKTDGGEMTIEQARVYADTFRLAGYSDWRLPDIHESFSILNLNKVNPAIDTAYYTKSAAEYWWSATVQYNDSNKIWVSNAGGGIGNHPKSETVSAGGTKKFHTRLVRDTHLPVQINQRFNLISDKVCLDSLSMLYWQRLAFPDTVTWEDALIMADTSTTGGMTAWRLPNIKELQSLNLESQSNPSFDNSVFTGIKTSKYWSSTTLVNASTKAWYFDNRFGISTYDLKTRKHYVLLVSGPSEVITGVAVAGTTSRLAYPNPFYNQISITSKEARNIRLFSISGKEIFQSEVSQVPLTLNEIPAGIYFLQILPQQTIVKVVKLDK